MQIVTTNGVQFPNGMPQIMGSRTYSGMRLNTFDDRHFTRPAPTGDPENIAGSFAGALTQALSRVEKIDNKAQQLTMQAIYKPDSVDVHNLIIAAEKARFALNLTKTIADGVIRSYRELTSPR